MFLFWSFFGGFWVLFLKFFVFWKIFLGYILFFCLLISVLEFFGFGSLLWAFFWFALVLGFSVKLVCGLSFAPERCWFWRVRQMPTSRIRSDSMNFDCG